MLMLLAKVVAANTVEEIMYSPAINPIIPTKIAAPFSMSLCKLDSFIFRVW